jgi:hypothetical protein
MKKGFMILCSLLFITGLNVAQTIKNVIPSGGNIMAYSPISIRWLALGTTNKFKVILLRNGVKVGVIQDDVSAGNGTRSIPWTAGQYIGGKASLGPGYRIKVKEKNKPTVGMSANSFEIVKTPIIKMKPTIQQMFTAPLGALKMESQLFLKGAFFGTNKGEILMYGNFPQSPVSLVDVNWVSSKKVNGKVPVFNTTGLPDQEVEIRVKRADNVLSNARQISFVGRKEQKILQWSDVVVVQCGNDGNCNHCNNVISSESDPWCFIDAPHVDAAIWGDHSNVWGAIGDDVGDDIYQISLKNGWYFKEFHVIEWKKTSGDEVLTGPNPPFPVEKSDWTFSVHWKVSPNDQVRYQFKIVLEGPLNTQYK